MHSTIYLVMPTFLLIDARCLSDTTNIKSIDKAFILFVIFGFKITLLPMKYSTSYVKWLSNTVAIID